MDTPTPALPRAYSPKEYWFLTFLFGPLPAYYMHRHNMRLLQSPDFGQKLRNYFLLWLVALLATVFIGIGGIMFVANLVLLGFVNEYAKQHEIPAIEKAKQEGRIAEKYLSPAIPALIGIALVVAYFALVFVVAVMLDSSPSMASM